MKSLRILIANNTFATLAGSETFAYTLAIQLKRMGHDVKGFSPILGIISSRLERNGIKCFSEIPKLGVKRFTFIMEQIDPLDFDVIIAAHYHIVQQLRDCFPSTPIISVIHGIIHKDEKGNWQPEHPAVGTRVDQYIAVSEEVKEKLSLDYGLSSYVVRNFIDLEEFKTDKLINDSPKQILVNTNYHDKNDPEIKVLQEVAKHFGAKLAAVGMNFSQTADIKQIIEESDIVVGLGRSVLEGMAMGRIGIVHGRWGTAGVVHSGNVDEMRKYNFSGRNSNGNIATAEELIADISTHYNQKTSEWTKKYIVENHNAVFAADAIIATTRELVETSGSVDHEEVRVLPYKRAL